MSGYASGYAGYPGGLALGGLTLGGLTLGGAAHHKKPKAIHKVHPHKKEDPMHYLARLEQAKTHAAAAHAARSAAAKRRWAALPAVVKAERIATLHHARAMRK